MSVRRLFLGKRGEALDPSGGETEFRSPTRWSNAVFVLRRDPLALFSLAWIALLIVIAIGSPVLAPYPAQGAGRTNASERLLPPSGAYLMGTDDLGRDILSRVMYATSPALTASLVVVSLAVIVGAPLGAMAGYFGGWLDEIVMRITDLFLAFPSLLLAMAIVTLLGPNLLNAVIALTVSWWPWYTRLVRGVTVTLRNFYFVEAARAIGVSDWTIIRRHVLPNCITPILVQATIDVGTVILATTSLAFIGLGARPPAADWGLMIENGREFINGYWWYSTFPGVMIFLTVLAFNLLGDTLRDIFDPRQYR
jgi:peptide/nickel transport system permease protein